MQPWQIATVRSLAGAVIVAGFTFFTQLAAGTDVKRAAIAAGAAAFGVLVVRGVAEGFIDQQALKP